MIQLLLCCHELALTNGLQGTQTEVIALLLVLLLLLLGYYMAFESTCTCSS